MLYYSDNDEFTTPEDVHELMSLMHNAKAFFYQGICHEGFLGEKAAHSVYKDIVKDLVERTLSNYA